MSREDTIWKRSSIFHPIKSFWHNQWRKSMQLFELRSSLLLLLLEERSHSSFQCPKQTQIDSLIYLVCILSYSVYWYGQKNLLLGFHKIEPSFTRLMRLSYTIKSLFIRHIKGFHKIKPFIIQLKKKSLCTYYILHD